MIGKVIQLNNGDDYYVVDAFKNNGRTFVFAMKVDVNTDIFTNVCNVCELVEIDGKYALSGLSDEDQDRINKLFLKKFEEDSKKGTA